MSKQPELRPTLYRFGAFELDSRNKTLMRNGEAVACAGQRFELLMLLLSHAGELVSRDTIQSRLWPDRHVAFDLGINGCVRDLRQILGESSDDIFIKTVPKHGYVFVAEVLPTTVTRGSQTNGILIAVAASILALMVSASLWWMGAIGTATPPPQLYTPPDAALTAYVRARNLYETHQPGTAAQAAALFRDAIAADENYALAWAGLADTLYYGGTGLPPDITAAREAADRAIALDPNLAQAILRQADIAFTHDWDSTRAASLFDRAIVLAPGDVTIRHSYSAFLLATGRPEQANDELAAALAIDPLSAVMANDLAWTQSLSGRHEAALETCAILAELAPDDARAQACRLRPLLALGRLQDAAGVAWQIMALESQISPDMSPAGAVRRKRSGL